MTCGGNHAGESTSSPLSGGAGLTNHGATLLVWRPGPQQGHNHYDEHTHTMPNIYWTTAAVAAMALGYMYVQSWGPHPKVVPQVIDDMVYAIHNDTEELPDDDGTEECKSGRRIRRGGRNNFMRHWVNWGKMKFPTAWRGASEADLACITIALSREMAASGVRAGHIARTVDLIAAQVVLPSAHQALANVWLSSRAAGEVQRVATGWVPRRTWAEWWSGTVPGGYSFKRA